MAFDVFKLVSYQFDLLLWHLFRLQQLRVLRCFRWCCCLVMWLIALLCCGRCSSACLRRCWVRCLIDFHSYVPRRYVSLQSSVSLSSCSVSCLSAMSVLRSLSYHIHIHMLDNGCLSGELGFKWLTSLLVLSWFWNRNRNRGFNPKPNWNL